MTSILSIWQDQFCYWGFLPLLPRSLNPISLMGESVLATGGMVSQKWYGNVKVFFSAKRHCIWGGLLMFVWEGLDGIEDVVGDESEVPLVAAGGGGVLILVSLVVSWKGFGYRHLNKVSAQNNTRSQMELRIVPIFFQTSQSHKLWKVFISVRFRRKHPWRFSPLLQEPLELLPSRSGFP